MMKCIFFVFVLEINIIFYIHNHINAKEISQKLDFLLLIFIHAIIPVKTEGR